MRPLTDEKVLKDADEDDSGEGDADEGEGEGDEPTSNLARFDGDEVDEGDEGEEGDEVPGAADNDSSSGLQDSIKKKKTKHLLMSPAELQEFKDAVEQTGIVFISRVPPFMGVAQLRQLLSPYGEIGRVYLTAEDKSVTKKRQRSGGGSRTKFVDGWVEFMRKKIAKRVCRSLNGTPIGGSHRSKFASDLWTLKYLRGFKWNHLTEKIAYERANRENKIQTELAQSKKQVKWTLQQAERAKVLSRIEKRGKRKPVHERAFKQRKLRTFDD